MLFAPIDQINDILKLFIANRKFINNIKVYVIAKLNILFMNAKNIPKSIFGLILSFTTLVVVRTVNKLPRVV